MSRADAERFVRSCGEDNGPRNYAHARELFEAIFGRDPDEEDGDQFDLWSQVCAAVS